MLKPDKHANKDEQPRNEAAWREWTFGPALDEWERNQREFKCMCRMRRVLRDKQEPETMFSASD